GPRPRPPPFPARRPSGLAAHRPGVPRRVLAVIAAPVALVAAARVAVAGARRPRRTLGVGRTVGAVPRAVLRWIALARRGAAHRARRLEGVGRADRARARAALVHVAHPGRRAAPRAGIARGVPPVRAPPVALVRRAWIAVGGARRPRRLLRIRGAVRPVPGAVLRRVALARRRAADGARGLEAIGGTGGARAAAGLRHVARPGRRAADRPRVPRRVLAGHVRPVALVERARVAVGGAGRAVRLLGIGRAVRSVPRAALREVAVARRCTADRARGEEAVGRAAPARPGAGLRRVAAAGRGAARGARRLQGAGRGAARRA